MPVATVYEVLVCARTAGSYNCTWISMKQNALCQLCCSCWITTLIENLKLCSSAEAGIVLNLFLILGQNWASCSYKIVLLKEVWLAFGSVTSIFRNCNLLELSLFCVFLENDKTDLCQSFSRFRRKHFVHYTFFL